MKAIILEFAAVLTLANIPPMVPATTTPPPRPPAFRVTVEPTWRAPRTPPPVPRVRTS